MYKRGIAVLSALLLAVVIIAGCGVVKDNDKGSEFLHVLSEKQDKMVITDEQGNTTEITDWETLERFSDKISSSVADEQERLAWTISKVPEGAEKKMTYALYPHPDNPEKADFYMSLCTYKDNNTLLTAGMIGVEFAFEVPEEVIDYLNHPETL